MKPTAFAATMALTLPLLATTSMTALAVTTDEFVNKVTTSNMFEIKSGKLASKKAKHEDVKAYGEDMVEDHTDANENLMKLIKDEKIDVKASKEHDEMNKENLKKLKNASGQKFDAIYVPMQVLAHEKAVNLFEDYSESGDNDALKDWAGDMLPDLKEHLKEARDLNEELSEPAKTAAATTDDKAMEETDKKTMDKVTDETDVDGTDKTATTEKPDDKAAMTDTADDKEAKTEMAEDQKPTSPSFDYVTKQQPTDWTAQALIGKTVMNRGGETLGEINNVILNEKGKVVAVTIGVGGFLGLGEKDVGVPFEVLKFRNEDVMEDRADADDRDAGEAEGHDDEVVVIDATKEQLEAAPGFVWLDERRDKRADVDTSEETAVE